MDHHALLELLYYNLSIIKTQTAVLVTARLVTYHKMMVLFGDDFAAFVVTTMGANPVGQPHFTAVAALHKLFWF